MRNRCSVFFAACGMIVGTAAMLPAQGVGTLKGKTTGPNGEALPGASISVTGTVRGAITRGDGTYRVTLPVGRYEVRARAFGFAVSVDSVTISAGATTTKDFTPPPVATNLETVAILGSRSEQRTVISAPVPVDVLSVADLQQSGRTETAQILEAAAPSINFPRASIADGSDHIRPATLRGLSPDQALILINGKRRHVASLVNLNGFVGRGSQAVDL